MRFFLASLIVIVYTSSLFSQVTVEGTDEKSSAYSNYLGFHDPIYFTIGRNKSDIDNEFKYYAQFQLSLGFELYSFRSAERRLNNPERGFKAIYTQTSYWDLTSKSQPFYDTSFKPGFIFLYQYILNNSASIFDRIDIEGGFQHHSNGKAGLDSRQFDFIYVKPTIVWIALTDNFFFFAPKIWLTFNKSFNNLDIDDYWGYLDFEFTWRANFGLQIETHIIPAKNQTTFNAQITYPMNNLWGPLNFYFYVDYWNGAGQTILRYDRFISGWIIGVSLNR